MKRRKIIPYNSKEKRLNDIGIHVLRFPDSEIFNDMENVLRVIEHYILDAGQDK